MAIISGIVKKSRTPGPSNEIDEIVSPVLFTQSLFGLQVLDPNWVWSRCAYIQVLLMCLTIYVIFGTLEVLKTTTDITMQMEGCYTFVIIFVFPLKLVSLVVPRTELQQVYLTSKTTLLNFVKHVSEEKAAVLLKKVQWLVYLLFGTVLFPVFFYVLTALCSTYVFGKKATLSKSTSTLMPMTSPYYEVGLILHAIFLIHMAFIFVVVDMWYIYLMIFFCTSNDCLDNVLRVSREDVDTNDSYAAKLNSALKEYYIAHEQQMTYFNILIKMYKWPSVIPLCHVLICLCSLLFTLSVEFNWAFISFASNILPTLGELFAFNWYGEQVKTNAVKLSMTLIDFDWPSMRLKDKKRFYIIVTYMQKEFGIKTAFGNHLSLVTMTSVLKASYQAFAVLKSMED